VSNDPGGQRWTRLIDESVDMFLAHCQPTPPPAKRISQSSRRRGSRP
jgi:hypothetical protein